MDRGARWATVHGITKSWTRISEEPAGTATRTAEIEEERRTQETNQDREGTVYDSSKAGIAKKC